MPNDKVLFVDDEANILDSFKRGLRKAFSVHTALGPLEGLQTLKEKGPFAVVVSDLKMPDMDGIAFLAKVREKSPDTVRIMLTGHGDMEVSIQAVNEGQIFRFLTKPCPTEDLQKAVKAGLDQYRLVISERELLRGTLKGSVEVLMELMSLANPAAFGMGERVKRHVRRAAKRLGMDNVWRVELAASLSQIGGVALSEEALRKRFTGESLTPEERQILDMVPYVGANLLSLIPRMTEVSKLIEQQNLPVAVPEGEEAPSREANLIHAALDFDGLTQGVGAAGRSKAEAISVLKSRQDEYAPDILAALEHVIFEEEGYLPRHLSLEELKAGMILADDMTTTDGNLLLSTGKELTQAALVRLKTFEEVYGVKQPVHVKVPIGLETANGLDTGHGHD